MMSPRPLPIDHVTLAGPDLDEMRQRLAELGLETEYGGPHDNGITHMALLGFEDGSYLELIAALDRSRPSPLWPAQIAGAGGPAAWCVRSDDLVAERARLAAAGVPAKGPVPMQRRRPDGVRLEWELLFPGDDPPGATLPFVIADRTPRELRVAPSPSARAAGLAGVGWVVLGVRSIAQVSARVQAAYGWLPGEVQQAPEWGATLAHVAGTPLVLAEPAGREGAWLGARLEQYGDSPCAFVFTTVDAPRAAATMPLGNETSWFGYRIGWIDPAEIFGWRIGVAAL
ncbi:MAG TPA: VOC family protein [Gemmatimonadales bacterium]|nr:VOC family protein [Gemmatimonadales bacterium]